MKKQMKSIVSLMMVVIMLMTSLPIGVFAEGKDDTENSVSEYSADSSEWEYQVLEDGTLEITGWNGSAVNLEIPNEIDGKKVTSIGQSVFDENITIVNVTVPEGVTSIKQAAFMDCVRLKTIDLPESLVEIGQASFIECFSLNNVVIPAGVKKIDMGAFVDCYSLTDITINGAETELADYCMGYYDSMPAPGRTIEDVVEFWALIYGTMHKFQNGEITEEEYQAIGSELMAENERLPYEVWFNDEIRADQNIVVKCFENSTTEQYAKTNGLKYKYIGDDSETAHKYVLTEIIEEATCTTDGQGVYTCECGDSYIGVIPANGHDYDLTESKEATCTEDGRNVYTCAGCGDSYTETFDALGHDMDEWRTTTNGSRRRECSRCDYFEEETSGTCGDNVYWKLDNNGMLTISGKGEMEDYEGDCPFDSNKSIKKVVIENGVTSIGSFAFSYCSNLTSIIIPDSVTSIGYEAFEGCISLISITIPTV